MFTLVTAALIALTSPPAPQKHVVVVAPKPSPSMVVRDPDSLVCSLTVVDWDVSKCLRLLSEQTHVNMVLLSNPGTKLTVRLEKVSLPDMVRHLCALTGLTVLKVGEAYVFANEEALKRGYPTEYFKEHPAPPPVEPPVKPERAMKVYRTNFVNAEALSSTLKELFPKEDVVIAVGPDVANPFLTIVRANESGDSASSVTQTAASESKAQYGDSVKRDALNKGRTIIINGEATLVQRVLDAAKQMDQPRRQVLIEVSVLETSDELARELGLSWTFGDVKVLETSKNGNGDTQSMNLGSFNRSPLTGTGSVKANDLRTKSRVLASPNISVLDGESSFVLIGNRIKYSVLKQPATQLSPAIYDVQEDRIGIYLQVAAQIASDGTITLNLYPQVSSISGYLNINGSNLPQISTREARTIMRMTSGQTIVMGGLIQDKDINTIEKVPILGDVPILGEFFKRRQKTKVASQLVITITPRIVDVQPAP